MRLISCWEMAPNTPITMVSPATTSSTVPTTVSSGPIVVWIRNMA